MNKEKVRNYVIMVVLFLVFIMPYAYPATISGWQQLKYGGDFSLNSSTLNIFTSNTSRVFVDALGKVGIGNTIPNVTLDISGSVNVSGRLSYGSLSANSPHFFETQGVPEPLCVKSSTGIYVGCIVDENFQFVCKVEEKCNRKYLEVKLNEEIDRLTKQDIELFNESLNSTFIVQTTNKKENKDKKLTRLSKIKKEVKAKEITVKQAINILKQEHLDYVDLSELVSEGGVNGNSSVNNSNLDRINVNTSLSLTDTNNSIGVFSIFQYNSSCSGFRFGTTGGLILSCE